MKLLGLDLTPSTASGMNALGAPLGSQRWDLNSPQAVAFLTGSDIDVEGGMRILNSRSAFKRNVWVQRCVTIIAQSYASTPIKVYRGEDPLEKHPLYDLLGNPNLYNTQHILKMITAQIMLLEGECFWLLGRNGRGLGPPKTVTYADPGAVTAMIDRETGELLAWRVRFADGVLRDVDPLDVAHFMIPNPYSRWRGISPLMAAGISVTSDVKAGEYNIGFFARGARPHGVLMTDKPLNKLQIDEIKERWRAEHALSHNVAVAHSGLKWVDTQVTQSDMEFSAMRMSNMKEIAAAFGVPPIKLGFDATSYANAREQGVSFWRDTMIPFTKLNTDTLDHSIVRDPGLETRGDFTGVEELREAEEKKIERAKGLWAMSVPFSDINDKYELGMPDRPHYKTGFVPIGVIPVEMALAEEEEPTTPPPPSDDDDDAIEGEIVDDEQIENSIETFAKELSEAIVVTLAPVRATPREIAEQVAAVVLKDNPKIKKGMRPFITQATAQGIANAADLLGDISFTIDDPEAIEFINDKVLKISGVNDTVHDRLRDLIASDIEDGMSVDEIADDLKGLYNKLTDSRSKMIARTEVGSALSGGQFMAYEAEGVTAHEWVDSGDERVRDTHAREHGNVVQLGEPFPVTNLIHPGDPNGDAAEVVNCRCVTLPVEGSAEEGWRRLEIDRDEYWRRVVHGSAPIERRTRGWLKTYFFQQRKAVLRKLEEVMK